MGNYLANREGEDKVNLILFGIVAFIEEKTPIGLGAFFSKRRSHLCIHMECRLICSRQRQRVLPFRWMPFGNLKNRTKEGSTENASSSCSKNQLQGREDCNCYWAVYEDMINVFHLVTLVAFFGNIQTPTF